METPCNLGVLSTSPQSLHALSMYIAACNLETTAIASSVYMLFAYKRIGSHAEQHTSLCGLWALCGSAHGDGHPRTGVKAVIMQILATH